MFILDVIPSKRFTFDSGLWSPLEGRYSLNLIRLTVLDAILSIDLWYESVGDP